MLPAEIWAHAAGASPATSASASANANSFANLMIHELLFRRLDHRSTRRPFGRRASAVSGFRFGLAVPLSRAEWAPVWRHGARRYPERRVKLGQHPCRFAVSHGAAGRV